MKASSCLTNRSWERLNWPHAQDAERSALFKPWKGAVSTLFNVRPCTEELELEKINSRAWWPGEAYRSVTVGGEMEDPNTRDWDERLDWERTVQRWRLLEIVELNEIDRERNSGYMCRQERGVASSKDLKGRMILLCAVPYSSAEMMWGIFYCYKVMAQYCTEYSKEKDIKTTYFV